ALAEGREGTRVPGALDPFIIAIRAVLGHQVTVRQATAQAGRLVGRFGDPMPEGAPEGLTHTFPTPTALAALTQDDIASLGMPGTRARTIIGLAQAVASGGIRLTPGVRIEETVAALAELPGFGPWTRAYIALRALADPDAFAVGDAGLARALGTRDPKQMLAIAEQWRPWRAYAATLLWEGA
ncbi:DNA-3-methyladenine glycosylase 2 family protein, partial [bacterium]